MKKQTVTHKFFGTGVIVAQDDKYITVDFQSKTCEFRYPNPDTFGQYLTLSDPELQAAVISEAEKEKEAAELARIQEKAEGQEGEKEACAAEQINFQVKKDPPKVTKNMLPAKHAQHEVARVAGKPFTFFAFQGETFEIESAGGFIWAPLHAQNGSRVFHWDNMLQVKKGDIVLHGCNGFIVAVSIAVSDCYVCSRPKERAFEGAGNDEGRRVDLDYAVLRNPLKTSDFHQDIQEYCKAKYSPFDKNGDGNRGYLYELNRELACIFLRAAIRINLYLSDIGCIKELLAGEIQ